MQRRIFEGFAAFRTASCTESQTEDFSAEHGAQDAKQGFSDVGLRAIADGDEVDIFRIAGRRREVHLVQDGPAAHGDLV